MSDRGKVRSAIICDDRAVLETSARLLRLLALLQSRRQWTGAELAERLGVTSRTIRNDVERLRELGYPVEAQGGVTGGYRLGNGGALPPLLLDDEEAVAVVVALRTTAGGSVAGTEETSLRALTKLEQMLPSRLRHRVRAFDATLALPQTGPRVSVDVLTAIAAATRDHEALRFDYRTHDGRAGRREVEPYRLVSDRRRWYLLAWDPARDDWRTFRVDRMEVRTPNGRRFTPRELPPDEEVASKMQRAIAAAPWRYRARVVVHAPAAHVRARIPVPLEVEELADDRCAFEPGSDHPEMLALYLGLLDAEFEVIDSPELVTALERMAGRFTRAAGGAVVSGPPSPRD